VQLQRLNEDKLNEERVDKAVARMIDALMTTPGITVPEMCAAVLRATHRVCRQGLEMSADGARLENEQIFRAALQDLMIELVDDRSEVH
jgi:hypothetical protein